MKPIGAERLRKIIDAQRDIMACGPDVISVMRVTTEWARVLTGSTASVIEMVDGDEMVYRAAAGTAIGSEGLRLKAASSLSGRCVLERRMLYAEDTESDPRVDIEACRRVNARSMLVLPLFYEARCVGVLKVLAPTPGAFDDDDVALLQLMVGFISSAMGHAAAHDAVLASENRFRGLAELAHDAIVTLDQEGRITFWNRGAERMFGYKADQVLGGPLQAICPEIDVATRSVHQRRTLPPVVKGATIPPPADLPLLDHVVELIARCFDGSEMPIELAVSAWSVNGQEQFTAVFRDIRERKRATAEAIDRFRIDQLTGLLVRRAGNEALRLEAERSRRHHHSYCVVLLDLDHFKRVNDNFGHHVGDLLLQRVGLVVRQILRETDIAVRWGGEELLLMLVETGREGGIECAERIRQAVEALRMEEVGPVSLSAGVACCADQEALEVVIERADEMLYAAKDAGRNRVMS
ncbi:MAG: diguanylate cyclase [Myxococcales bacterium]